jgi:hypothetical protein
LLDFNDRPSLIGAMDDDTLLNPLLMFLDVRREHVDVLHNARPPMARGPNA